MLTIGEKNWNSQLYYFYYWEIIHMLLTEARRQKYIKYRSIKRLGDLFRYCYENDFYLEEDYNEYLYSDENGSDGLRIVYLNMIYEDLIAEYEHRNIEYYVVWQDPDEPPFRKDILSAFCDLMVFKYRGIDTLDGVIDFLNEYPVNHVISANAPAIFYALDEGGCIVNHWLIYYGDMFKELRSFNSRLNYLYKLNLESGPQSFDAKKIWRESFDISDRYKLHYDKDEIVELDSKVCGILGDAMGGNYIIYDKEKSEDSEDAEDTERFYKIAVCNVNTNKVTEYDGAVVAYNDGVVIVQHKNELYRIEGGDVRKIFSLNTDGIFFEYIDTEVTSMRQRFNRLLIAPVIRGAFLPYEIDFDGKYIGVDSSVAEYEWWTALSLDYSLTKCELLSYQMFNYISKYGEGYDYEKFRIEDPVITVNGIKGFMHKYEDSEPELIKSMQPFILLVFTLGHVIDHDADISDLLFAIRIDYLRSDEGYWRKLLDMFYSNLNGQDEIVGSDLLSQWINEKHKYVIGYKYNRFVSEEYVDGVVKDYEQGKLMEYIENVWFEKNAYH